MFKQILKTKDVPERDINEMIAGWLDLILRDKKDTIKFTEYKKFDVEKEDGDMENINYEGKTADDKVDQSRKSSLN